jgi:hypothetical protein
MALLAGCAPGLMGGDKRTDPALDRILVSDADVPARQGLLFMAMQDAAVARQSAGFALAADNTADAKAQINNLLYAIDPEFPPTPTVTASGVTPFWPPTGYGLRRSMQDIADEIGTVSSRHDGRAAVVAQAQQVSACTVETLSRIDRLTSLAQQALAAGSADGGFIRAEERPCPIIFYSFHKKIGYPHGIKEIAGALFFFPMILF